MPATLTAAPPEETVAAVARAWQRQSRATAVLKRFASADEVRTAVRVRLELVRTPSGVTGRARCEPGFRWTRDVGEALRVDRPRTEVAGVVLEGTLEATAEDGTVRALEAGTVFHLPAAAHDFAVAGDAPCVALLTLGADRFVPAARGLEMPGTPAHPSAHATPSP